MNSHLRQGLLAGIAAGSLFITGPAHADEITVIASAAVRETYVELVSQFELSSHHTIKTIWSGTADIMKRVKAGESADLVIVGDTSIDELIRLGKVVPGSRVDLMKSGIGVAVRAGAARPDIGSSEALKHALLSAKSVGYSSGPSGVYLDGLFERMGIAADVKAKTVRPPSGASVGEAVAGGEADIGFQQISELIHVAGIEYLGPLSSDVQQITVFSSGIHMSSKAPAAAAALAAYLSSPAAAAAMRKNGMEPS